MKISPERCVGCGNCVPVCPMGAISVDPDSGRARVDAEACVECYACYRGMSTENLPPTLVRLARRAMELFRVRFDPEPDVCPTSAIVPEDLEWPRSVRRAFSDVQVSHAETEIEGRGTEEVKTNDVTGRIGPGEVGLVVELGRPGVGTDFRDIETMTTALAGKGVEFEPDNPVTSLMTDASSGRITPDVLDERVMSAIVEFKIELAQLTDILPVIQGVASEIDTVVSLGVSACSKGNTAKEVRRILEREGYGPRRAKTNLGLGHRLTGDEVDTQRGEGTDTRLGEHP